MSKDKFSPESIQGSIDWNKGKRGLAGIQETIDFYKEVGANKDMSWYEEQASLYEQEILNLETLLKEGAKDISTIKVRVTEYKGNVIVETVDPEEYDQDFSRNVLGSIGCTLYDNKRLEISQEAKETIRTMRSSGDGMGDFMGDKEQFTWIGGPFCVKDQSCVRSRDYRSPEDCVEIDNEPSQEAKDYVDAGKHIRRPKPASEAKHDLWIEFTQPSDYIQQGEGQPSKRVGLDYYGLGIRVINHDDHVPHQTKEDLKKLVEGLFEGYKSEYRPGGNFYLKAFPVEEVMSFVNGLFAIGFDNNIMNPRMDYWRMSLRANTADLKKALKSFKRE